MNLLKDLPTLQDDEEVFETLLQNPHLQIERIVSKLKNPGQWYDQDHDEWVVLIEGQATIEFFEQNMQLLSRGDTLLIEAHQRHRVISTSEHAVWLAVHLKDKAS